MSITPIKDGTWVLPCLSCGKLLDYEVPDEVIKCSGCGLGYDQEALAKFRVPGSWRHWIATFACACPGRVTIKDGVIWITEHRCLKGRVTAGGNSN